ncbi:MAG: tetratricopeptide repeat protein [Acidobacteriota bacterium]|nr:tetratricopeptide repeat protein [Acidobacteriota bacterium]
MVLPDNFKTKLTERKVVPFVGAGVSMNVKDKDGNSLFPSWGNLLLASAEKLKNDGKESEAKLIEGNLGINPPDYLEAAKTAQRFLGAELYDLIKEKISARFENVDLDSLRIPQVIWEISNNLIITTNYDKALSWSCPNQQDLARWNIEAPKEQADLIRTQTVRHPIVWHLHGHIDDVHNIILTPDGYEKLYPTNAVSQTKYEAALRTLQTLFVSHTFLFIGFSLYDEYFVNQLRYVQKLFQGTTNKHYVLIRETERAKLSSLNLEIEPITFESFGDKMLEKLYEIRDEANLSKTETKENAAKDLTATERYNPKNRVVHIPFNQKGDQVVGREEDLEQVHKTLSQGLPTNIGQAVSFQGLGGLGKTQLAVEYAYKFQSEYPNGVIWLTVDQDIDKQLVEVSDKAEWVSPLSEIKVKLDVARNRLKTITDCLIVLDNVETFDERIKEYLPAPQKDIHILATSRYEIVGFNPVKLELLTTEQSVQMLEQESRHEIKDETERETVGQIAEELGNLPLALELAGGFLRYRPIGWGNYLSLLKQNPREAFKEKFLAGSFTNHDKDVYRTLKVGENILNEELLLRDVLDLLTWSGTSAMGVDLMSSLLGKSEIELLEVLSLGDSLNLLIKSSERNAYAIHRLVGEVRKEDIPLEERADWINNICQLLGDWFEEKREDFIYLREFEAEIEHLIKWQMHALKFSTEHSSRLLWLQFYPHYHHGTFLSGRQIIEESLKLYELTNCSNEKVLSHIFNDYGIILYILGNIKDSLSYSQKALQLRKSYFGDVNVETAASHNNLANALSKLGRITEAIKQYELALSIISKLDENNRTLAHESIYYSNLGNAYRKQNKHEEQYKNQKKSLEIRFKLYGERHPLTANILHNLSFYFQKVKDFKTATDIVEKALDIQQELLGYLHADTINSIDTLAYIFVQNNRGDEALKLIEKFLQVVPQNHQEYKVLENRKCWILQQTRREGFRQQPVNPARKKGKKKRK